jgi:hypothetical protein
MKIKNEDPKVGVFLVMVAPIVTANRLIYGPKRTKALVEGLSILAAGTLILVSIPITKIGKTIRGVFRE